MLKFLHDKSFWTYLFDKTSNILTLYATIDYLISAKKFDGSASAK